jgi:hypothetical protein
MSYYDEHLDSQYYVGNMNKLSKREMINLIMDKAKQNNDKVYRYELQIKSLAFVEHFYKWYVLNEKVEQFDLT